MRLDKFIANNTALTRRQVHRAVRSGLVSVDGETVSDVSMKVTDAMHVLNDGRPVLARLPLYLMLNKPQGVVCATSDPEHQTVMDLIQDDDRKGLHMAGRLDIDTTGLVLLTDDGDWSHRIASPRKGCGKIYLVGLAEPLPEEAAALLRQGILLRNEKKPTQPADVERVSDKEIRLTIREGKYHQVKRMLAAVGNRVISLHRERIGVIELDAGLDSGEYRALTPDEISSV